VVNEIDSLGKRALPIAADIGNFQDIERAIETTLKPFPRIDVLVNNAGITPILKRPKRRLRKNGRRS
jgi:NAD(P)-dependent dehydrogenase (short-subunit alcohol dehydrogenase family)